MSIYHLDYCLLFPRLMLCSVFIHTEKTRTKSISSIFIVLWMYLLSMIIIIINKEIYIGNWITRELLCRKYFRVDFMIGHRNQLKFDVYNVLVMKYDANCNVSSKAAIDGHMKCIFFFSDYWQWQIQLCLGKFT